MFAKKIKRFRASLLSTTIILPILFTASPVSAETANEHYFDTLQKLSEISEGHPSVSLLDQYAAQESERTGKTKQELADQAYAASISTVMPHYRDRSARGKNGGDFGDQRKNNLVDSTPGVIFMSEGNSTWIAKHGHVGIYVTNNRIVEAPGNGLSHETWRWNSAATGFSSLLQVTTSEANKTKAVKKAKTYIGREYNSDIFNKNPSDSGPFTCSQLVWAAYKYGAGVDILPGKTYKLPLDIRDSEMTRAFAWIQPQG